MCFKLNRTCLSQSSWSKTKTLSMNGIVTERKERKGFYRHFIIERKSSEKSKLEKVIKGLITVVLMGEKIL